MIAEARPTIVHVVHSLEGGGTERGLIALLRETDVRHYRHVVVTQRQAGALCVQLPDQVVCIPLGARGRCWTLGYSLARVLRSEQADVLHARNTGCWPDAIVASLLTPSVKLVLGFHGLETDEPLTARHRRWIRLARLTGAVFTSVSRAGQQQLSREGGVRTGNVHVLPNGVDAQRFGTASQHARRNLRRSMRLGKNAFVLGSVGSLTPVKRHADLIRALAHCPKGAADIHALIVGDGPLRSRLKHQAAMANVHKRVHFIGWREDVADCLSAMDAYVCCSASEGISRALLEAMAAGLPIISTNVGDHATVVRHGTDGYIVGGSSHSELVTAIQRLALRNETAREMGRSAQSRVADFSLSRMAECYTHFYDRLILGQAATAAYKAPQRRAPRLA